MKRTILLFSIAALLLSIAGPSSWADCANANQASHFSYSPTGLGPFTFLGTDGAPISATFTVTAPDSGEYFPGQGQLQGQCLTSALADFKVFEIFKIADADGNALSSPLPITDGLYNQLSNAFVFIPSSGTFYPSGSSVVVDVAISNPNIASGDYGWYEIKLGAQAIGAGIGVSSGTKVILKLLPLSNPDETAPDVGVTCPADGSTKLLGVIAVCVWAEDPEPGSGLASLTAAISSAGGAVSNANIPLTLSSALPVAAGVEVTGTGAFTPTGGTGVGGTTLADAFDNGSGTSNPLSGNGTYTITAAATDVAGNSATGTSTFKVQYNVAFRSNQPDWKYNTGQHPENSFVMVQFTANRGGVADDGASDGAFMYDQTITVQLWQCTDSNTPPNCSTESLVRTHVYGTGSVNAIVQIDSTPFYQSKFICEDLGASGSPARIACESNSYYRLKILYRDVDGNLMLQKTSSVGQF